MSLTTDSARSDHEPERSGLHSPLYGTATFTSLSPSTAPAPLSDAGASSTRLSYPSRSVTPSTSDDGTRLRRVAISPTVSSYDSRRYTDSGIHSDDNDNSITDSAEVEEVLSRVDDDEVDSQVSGGDNWSSSHSSSEASAASKSATGSYATATTEPLNFAQERRSLSTISERTESQSLSSGIGAGTSILQNLFSVTFSRPSSFMSAAARSLYGAPASPLTPPSTVAAAARPATPERLFKPAPPTGRRVGNLVASFESDIGQSRPGSVPLGARSPSPFTGSSRPTSPTKSSHSRANTDGSYTHSRSYTEGSIMTGGHTHSASFSSYLSPVPPTSALSRSTVDSSETERPRSPLSSVQNIVSAWKERSPEKASSYVSSASRSTASLSKASQSAVSGPSYSSGSMSSLGLFGGGIFSLRRRAAASATSGASRSRGTAPSYTDDFGSTVGSNTDTRSLARSGSVRSAGGSSIFDMSELGSFIRGSQEPLRIGSLWYLNVHAPPPFRWQRCRAILYPNTLLLTWLAPGGGRGVITLDLVNCNEVRSVPSPSHISARDDIGTIAARLQMDEGGGDTGHYDLLEMLCPFQLLYSDGVERLGAESARERVQWVGAIWEALDRAVAPPDRSMTVSPTGSIRTIRSVTSSVVSAGSGSGSGTTTYLPPLDTIPDLSDLDTTSLTRSLSRQDSFTSTSLSSYGMTRTRSSDDGAIFGRGGLLHPLDARGIEIAPSRSSSLRRTSSLADLDAEFASVLRGTGITIDTDAETRTRRRGSSRFSARWTRGPSEYSAVTSTVSPSESASNAGVTRRVRASTFYTLSEPTFTALSADSGTISPSLCLRGPSSASLLGDSHDGPPTSEDSQRARSPASISTPTRTRSPDTLYTSTSGLSRASAVRRRTPRSTRTYSRSASSKSAPSGASTSDKENEYTEGEPSQWSSLQGSYTSTSYEYSEYINGTRTPSEPSIPLSPRQERIKTPIKPASENDDDVFVTPTASRSATSYHSMPSVPGTPTPSSTSLTEFDTAKAASTEYVTAEVCPSEPPSTEYTTAEVCPSTPPATEYFTAECRCQKPPPSPPEQISSLTPSLSLISLSEEKSAEPETESLYVSSVPSIIEANIPLPEPEGTQYGSLTPSPAFSTSPIPTPVIETPTPSSVTETSIEPTSSVTRSSEYSSPPPSSPSSPSIVSVPSSPSTPSSPTSESYRSESSRTPKSRSLYVPSQSSPKSTSPSISDYDSMSFLPSPSLFSLPLQEQADISFETSFMRPETSEMVTEQSPSPFLPRGMEVTGISSTATPTSTSVGTTSDLSPSGVSPTVTRTRTTEGVSTPSSVSTTSSLSSTQVSTLTPSSALLTVPPARSPRRTATPSSLTPSSYVEGSTSASSEPYTTVSSLTPSGPFEDRSVLGGTVTVTRTPSSVSTVSTTSMDSAIFAPSVYESPPTVSGLLSSRATTPRPMTPRDVPLPSSPSLTFTTATPSDSISTPRTDARTLTSVATTDILEAPREEILTHDVNRLLRYLHDLDQIRGGETQDMKDHLQRIEDELRGLSDFLRKPAATLKDRSIGSSVPISRTAPSERVSSPRVATTPQRPSVTSVSTPPLPVPAPPGVPTTESSLTPRQQPSLTPQPQTEISFSYSPSTISRDLSVTESPQSEQLSIISPREYPTVPISPPGSPSSPSSFGSGWPSLSTDAPPPPSSVTPSSVTRSSIRSPVARELGDVSDLTAESPFVGTTPLPLPSPLASLASRDSLPLPPQSNTPSEERRISPAPAAPYAGSPLPTPSPFGPSSEGSLSIVTIPPSSTTPSSSPPSTVRAGPSIEIRQPASPVLSISEAEPPSPGSPGSAILSETPRAEAPSFPIPEPPIPIPEVFSPVPSPPIQARPPVPGTPRALDDLRDLLEDLRNQAQALWNGQQATNRMVEDLARRPTSAGPPAVDRDEIGNRLRNIEDLLDGILRDLERGFAPEEPASEISSDTSSALRRYIDRLRDRRQEVPGLHAPTPVRAPPPALDQEWLEFLSEPQMPDQPVQGPPPLAPLYRRAPRRRRELSTSPPISVDFPARPSSVPPMSPYLPRPRMRQPWRYPRVPPSELRPESVYEPGRPISDFRDWPDRPRPGPSRPGTVRGRTRPQSGPDIDMLREIENLRRQARGGDGRVDLTRPPEERSPTLEAVPPPMRVQTAPPTGQVHPPAGQQQVLGDQGTVPAPYAPTGPAPQIPIGAQPTMPMPPVMAGPPPPYDEMLRLLRQNRLAQTASIDQQREIMRYMRLLNEWLERDVRDRHNEMRGLSERLNALANALRQPPAPGGIPVGMPPVFPGQPQVPGGQTYIVPPFPFPQPMMPGGPGIPPPPGPAIPFTPGPGVGPPVVPPTVPGSDVFIPPHPSMPEPPVVPDISDFDRPPYRRPSRRRSEDYADDGRRPGTSPFVPPRPSPSPTMASGGMVPAGMVPVPPPGMAAGPPITVIPPVQVQRSRSSSPTRTPSSSRTPSPQQQPIHVHVHSPTPTDRPPQVVRVDDGGRPEMPSGPLHPALSDMYSRPPTTVPQQPIVVAPPPPQPQPPPTVPSAFPAEQPTQPVIIRSDRPYSPQDGRPIIVTSRRSRSRSRSPTPTRVVIRPASSRRSRTSPPSRLHRPTSERDPYRHDRYSPSPSRRRRPSYDEADRPRSRSRSRSPTSPHVIRVETQPSGQPPVLIPGQQQPPTTIFAPPPPSRRTRSRSRSRSRSRTPPPVLIQQPQPGMYGPPGYPQQPVTVIPPPQPVPVQPTVLVPPPTSHVPSRVSREEPVHYSPPITYMPTDAPTQPPPHVIHVQSSRRGSRSPERSRSPRRYSPHDPSRLRRYPEDDERSRRQRRPSYDEGDEGDEGDRPRRRPPRDYPEDDERYRRQRRPSYDEGDAGDGPRRRPPGDYPEDDRRRRRPSYDEGDEGDRPRRRPPRDYPEDDERYRRQRRPSYDEDDEGDRPRRRSPRDYRGRSPSPGYSPRPVTAVGLPPSHREEYERPSSPTRVVVRPGARSPERVVSPQRVVLEPPPPPGVPYPPPSSAYEPESHVVRVPSGRRTPPTHLEAEEPAAVPSRFPTRREERSPTVIRVPSGRHTPLTHLEAEEPAVSIHPSGYPVSEEDRRPIPPPSPGAAFRSAILGARSDTEPVIPIVPVPGRVPTHAIPPEPSYQHEEDIPQVIRTHPSRRSPDIYERPPSGPGDLALQDALRSRQERLDEQERRLEDLNREAEDAEERREQYFREHEEDRERLFRENEERRLREAAEAREEFEHLRDEAEQVREELEHSLEDIRPHLGLAPGERPPAAPGEEVAEPGVPSVAEPGAPSVIEPGAPSAASPSIAERESVESLRPVPPPLAPVTTEGLPQLQEILDLLRQQQGETTQCKAQEQERFDILRDEIDQARADAKAECEERIRVLEDDLARAREELEREREQRTAEDLERMEREHADVIERDEAMRAQLGDITNIVQEQREELIRKRELMDERWAEKQNRREEKQGRNDTMYRMLEQILQEREEEKREREAERAAAAERPSIETVLEELRRQNEQQIQLINNLTDAWRADSARQHEDTLNAVRATAQEMVPYNLTGYLDEFSKALAGEIRTLLGEVGRLHEQKRTLQFEIGDLLHWKAQYGPGGLYEPEWHPTEGPLAPQPPPGAPGGPPPPPPPGPEEPPQPARPAWRTVQQRAPRRRRTRGEPQQPQQAPTVAPTEPIPHPPSWQAWQPNPAFVPTPPPPGASPLVVPPPSGPTGLFGPRSPRGTMYAG